MLFYNRKHAGEKLAGRFVTFANRLDVIVLSTVPGGVSIGFEISKNLNLQFDLFLMEKYRHPNNKKMIIGATSLEEMDHIDKKLITQINISPSTLLSVKEEAKVNINQQNLIYRNNKKWITIENQTVILADDGSAEEIDIILALKLIGMQYPRKIILATPIINYNIIEAIKPYLDRIIFLIESSNDIANCYEDFQKLSISEIKSIKERSDYHKLVH